MTELFSVLDGHQVRVDAILLSDNRIGSAAGAGADSA